MKTQKELNTLLTVIAIVIVLALTACGKSDERFYSSDASTATETPAAASNETPASTPALPSSPVEAPSAPSFIDEIIAHADEVETIVVSIPVEQVDEVVAQIEEVAVVEVKEETKVEVIVEVNIEQVEQVKEVIEVVAPVKELPAHCTNGKGKDAVKSKACIAK